MMRTCIHLVLLVGGVALISGCSLLFPPPRLPLTHEELVEAERSGNSNPEKAAIGRERLLQMHPEWSDSIQTAVRAGQLTKEMTRTQALAAWGVPSSRRGGMIVPAGYEHWTCTQTRPHVVVEWDGHDRMWWPKYEGDEAGIPPVGAYGWILRSR
jgi:hypothetical protein